MAPAGLMMPGGLLAIAGSNVAKVPLAARTKLWGLNAASAYCSCDHATFVDADAVGENRARRVERGEAAVRSA